MRSSVECESVRGEWSVPGKLANRCPDCGAPMPYDFGPLSSEWARRDHDETRAHAPSAECRLRVKHRPKMTMYPIGRRRAA